MDHLIKIMLLLSVLTGECKGLEKSKKREIDRKFYAPEKITEKALSDPSGFFFQCLAPDSRKAILGMTPLHVVCKYGTETDLSNLLAQRDQICEMFKGINVEAKRGSYKLFDEARLNICFESERDTFRDARRKFVHDREDDALSVVEDIVKRSVNLERTDIFGRTMLHIALAYRHDGAVARLIEAKANVNAIDDFKRRPLHFASQQGNVLLLQFLLGNPEVKSHINAPCLKGKTPLHLAAASGNFGAVMLLLAENAKVDVVDEKGRTPLYQAAKRGYLDIVVELLKKGAAIDKYDNSEVTPFSIAAGKGYLPVVQYLAEKGASINKLDKYRDSAFSRAAENGHAEVITFLYYLRNKEGRKLVTLSEGRNALDGAVYGNKPAIVNLLLRTPLGNGRAPLHSAVLSNFTDVVEQLLWAPCMAG
jgi:ankyrin repeat protein